MARRYDEVLRQPVVRPRPETFSFHRQLDWMELQLARKDPQHIIRLVKQEAAHRLANHILEHCQFIDSIAADRLCKGLPLRIELTVNDRGMYENWLPHERHEGRQEGWKRAREAIPYGMEVAEDI